jgi:signal transduction histidine kinase
MDFKKVTDSCIREIQPLLADKKLDLKQEIPEGRILIQGDEIRLCQVLMNLLSNAAKFSHEGNEVTLHVEEKNSTVKVWISDNGIGIRKEDLPRIFEPFAAIKKPSYIKGTGLGLSVTKGLVEAHGGKIWAESPGEERGATFTFTLPKPKEDN